MTGQDAGSLAARLAARNAAFGPLSIADYMDACLADPEHGYYKRRDPFGASGDFTTAPEISQIFGELIGLWCAEVWRGMGSPAQLRLAEIGPGRGTLMADALRAAASVPGFRTALRPLLVETSPALTAIQQDRLAASASDAAWLGSLEDVPDGAMIVVANELLDALPIRQFAFTDAGWRERCVAVAGDGRFTVCLRDANAAALAAIPATVSGHAREGDIFEMRSEADALAAQLGRRAAKHPLAALFIDYGHDRSAIGDTLQAVRRHRPADPFSHPGECDLTAHVDFGALARSARDAGLEVHGPMPQGRFLNALGLAQRASRLMAGMDDPAKASLIGSGARRLADPGQMGELFRVISLTGPHVAIPPAFEEAAQ
ncbi:MAG: SAM-dependent methyltransferase [Pseudomonadota bacterium]|nr:SAM-dependent methyltransferase [Pseudomonadota bacterium]